jgi:hypothetical protein
MSNDLEVPAPRFERDGHTYELCSDRIVRDGSHFGVLVSPGFGAGFVTWCNGVSPTEPKIVATVLAGRADILVNADPREIERELGAEYVYLGGVSDLEIEWLPIGTRFRIEEYDGSESVTTADDLFYS